jgi:hypothetical protein
MTTTNVDCGSVQVRECEFKQELVTFAGDDTFVEGTVLARQDVSVTLTAGAVQGGTGTGTLTVLSIPHSTVVPIVGVWRLEITEAVANGGVFRLVDPNGMIVATDIRMTVGSTVATVVEVAGMLFTITDATDFVAANYFEITVAAGSGKLVPYSRTGAGGAQFPKFVLAHTISRVGAGDVPASAIISGVVAKERLVIDAVGTPGSITDAELDMLRSYGIQAISVSQLGRIDNPQ